MAIIDRKVHGYAANAPKRPWQGSWVAAALPLTKPLAEMRGDFLGWFSLGGYAASPPVQELRAWLLTRENVVAALAERPDS
jgi:hypothetical protein